MTTGAAGKYQDLSIILAHAGGFLPYVAARIAFAASAVRGKSLAQAGGPTDADLEVLKRFYVDTALSGE